MLKVDRRRDLARALPFALERAPAERIGVLLPERAWATAIGAELRRRGLETHVGEADPWAVLDQTRQVVVAGDDELGLLALLAGQAVRAWSGGYLTGWGLTEDHPRIAARGRRTRSQVAAAALVDGVRYIDPFTGRIARCEEILAYLSGWRRIVDEDRDLACLAGVARWKRGRLRRFLAPSARRAPFLDQVDACLSRARATGGAVAVWPSAAPAALADRAGAAKVPLRRIEDGFVRSVGLGSDLSQPCSIVVDRSGVYYDPSRPSDLELILANATFTSALRRRAQVLVRRLKATRLTKYNMGGGGFSRPSARRVVLVPGQVEDDQSFQLGGAGCAGNLDLLRRARAHEPDAFILYRPHPDVEAGNRIGAVPDAVALEYADAIDRTSAMPALLEGVDAVHTVSSLAGFEALLRDREVVVHGQPFYSGWGLTRDLAPVARRGRPLGLDELVAGALILYPRYLDPRTGLPCPPEVVVDRLAQKRPGPRVGTHLFRALRRRFEPRGLGGPALVQPEPSHV